MSLNQSGSGATIDNLIAQMSRGVSVLNGWDAVLNIDEGLVNAIFQAQFKQSAREDWKNITFAFCQLFPNPGGGKLALYTGVNILLATPSLTFLGDNQAFVELSFKATGRTGAASKVVSVTFDPKKDCDPNDPALDWTYTSFSDTAFTGKVPLSAVTGSPQTGGGMTDFVIDFPSGSFTSPVFDTVKDPDELRLRLKDYLETHDVQYVINSIRTDLVDQIPQMAPKSFRIAVLTTNEKKNVFQIFIATQNPAGRNLTITVNEPIPDGSSLSVMFNKSVVGQLGTSLMVQAWLFMQSNLIFPGRTSLSLGPRFTPGDALILGKLDVDTSSSIIPIEPTKPPKERNMLNIQKTRQITPDGQSAFTAYGDDKDSNLWYVPPKVVWAINSTSRLPQLSVIKYKLTGGAVQGFCRLSVQLMVDPAQEAALKKTIPGAVLGQFDWISSKAVFTYTIAGKSTSIQGQPSSFGSQTVTFSVPLEDDKAIAAFVNAFSTGSSSGTFAVSYELAAETRLPAVTVVSRFDSTIAYQYQVENRYRTETQYHTNTWGQRRSEQVTVFVGTFVREMMQQTQAATVKVTPGQGLTPALLSMVQTWADTQLQKDVEQAVNTALSLIKNPTANFSMNSVAGFTHTLQTDNVVPWYFQVEGPLPPVNAGTWQQVYSEVNQQQLEVTFEIQEDLADHGVSRVNLTFQYGSAPLVAHTFAPQAQEPWFISAPGIFNASEFKADYKYKYDVIYAAPAGGGQAPPPLSTDWITNDSTSVKFGLVQLGLLAVTFQASNIGWGATPVANQPPTVKEITVNWNWLPGGGGAVLSQSLVLNDQSPSVTSTLRSTGPTNNQQYQYSLTFLMSDGTKLGATGLTRTDPICPINHPLSEVSVGVFPLFSDGIKAVILRATFDDEKNGIHLSKQWLAKAASSTPGGTPVLNTDSFASWDFQAVVANLNLATVVFSGTWVDKENKQHTIPKMILVGSNNTLVISDTQRLVTAVIDASNVAFVPPQTDGVYRVVALVTDTESNTVVTGATALANASTIAFGQDGPPIQYYTTQPLDIAVTPTFYYQYIYTLVRDKGAHTDEVNKWTTPQSTVSTALPVISGKPTAMPMVAFAAAAPGLDRRSKELLARHDSFVASSGSDLALLLS